MQRNDIRANSPWYAMRLAKKPFGLFGVLAAAGLMAVAWLQAESASFMTTGIAKTGTEASAQIITLTDQRGKPLALARPATRIIAIPIPLASLLMAVDGGTARIAGMNAAARSDLSDGLLGRMFPQARMIPTEIAGDDFVPNVEALAAARPDLVLQWGDRGEAIIAPMQQLDIPVLGLVYGDSLLAADWLRLTGKAIGKAERGEKLARWFETSVAQLARMAATIPDREKPRVLYLMRARTGLTVAGKGSSMDSDIRRMGGRNPAAAETAFAQISVEQLLAWNPDVLLLNNFEGGLGPEELYRDSRLRGLKAVAERRVYGYPRGGFRWDPPSQETPLSQAWLFQVLHPEREKMAGDLRAQLVEAYRELYGYALTPSEVDEVLRLKDNGGSLHYRALFAARTTSPLARQ
ncbi:MAG: ABC transporter substrate-binding protein [Zoogloeaceae bacterium]|nr:ABC transporter substrate-binding protein [Zoogloeaceae bacterium]